MFSGEREHYQEWFRVLKNHLLEKGLFNIASNITPRPTNIQPEYWHADPAHSAMLSQLRGKVEESQRRWDSDNGKAWATITGSLDIALQKRYDDPTGLIQVSASWLLLDLRNRYGGAYDSTIKANFLVEFQKPIPPNQRFETWSAGWEDLHKKRGIVIEANPIDMLAYLKLVIYQSGMKQGERFNVDWSFVESLDMDYPAARDFNSNVQGQNKW